MADGDQVRIDETLVDELVANAVAILDVIRSVPHGVRSIAGEEDVIRIAIRSSLEPLLDGMQAGRVERLAPPPPPEVTSKMAAAVAAHPCTRPKQPASRGRHLRLVWDAESPG